MPSLIPRFHPEQPRNRTYVLTPGGNTSCATGNVHHITITPDELSEVLNVRFLNLVVEYDLFVHQETHILYLTASFPL